jgi:mRNA interferase RelE/StbE
MERVIVFTQQATAEFLALHPRIRETIEEKLDLLATNPAALVNQIKRLKGVDALRFRVGDYRIIFTDSGVILNILRIGHRSRIY